MAGDFISESWAISLGILTLTPADELLDLNFLMGDAVPNSMAPYILPKRAYPVRVTGEAIAWGECAARVKSISPGIVLMALACHELESEISDGYRAMVAASPAGRTAPADAIAVAAAYLLGPNVVLVTGSDLLIDGETFTVDDGRLSVATWPGRNRCNTFVAQH